MQVSTCIPTGGDTVLSDTSTTRDHIIQAALVLIRTKGIKGATTLAIAKEAGVNEVTIFRHFKNKEGLLKAVIQKVSYTPSLSMLMKEHVVGDLEKDLYTFAKHYHRLLRENADLISMTFKEPDLPESLLAEVANIPRQLKDILAAYFSQMKSEGKLIDTHIETQALTFIWTHFGFFQSSMRHGDPLTEITEEAFIRNSVQTFARGLKP
jgi:AcrR family transcriptional regulator